MYDEQLEALFTKTIGRITTGPEDTEYEIEFTAEKPEEYEQYLKLEIRLYT